MEHLFGGGGGASGRTGAEPQNRQSAFQTTDRATASVQTPGF